MVEAFVALGSNLDDRVQHIINARNKLIGLSYNGEVFTSGLYLTSSVGDTTQADYINSVVYIQSDMPCDVFFARLQTIETELGRVRDPNNQYASRLIDIDLIFYGNHKSETKKLTLPHPRYKKRLFVLLPLLELAVTLDWKKIDLFANLAEDIEQTLQQGERSQHFLGQKIIRLS